jgi:two-component sensor histidine kinase
MDAFGDNMAAVAEARRMEAVRRYDILDTPPDGAFDRVTAIAARLFGVPIAIVSIVDHDRIWFKSHHGLDEVSEIPRGPGLCASAILGDAPWIIENAATDVRALTNPLVAGAFGLRFYAGVPLRTQDGHNLGTLCVIDHTPRQVTEAEIATLSDLAAIVMDELELRLAARRAIAAMGEEVAQRRRMQAHQQVLLAELDHRVKNSLATVQAIALQTGRSAASIEEFLGKFDGRLLSLARAHGLLTSGGWTGGDLRALALLSLGAYQNDGEDNIHLSGPAITLTPKAAMALNLVFSELATNAAKYGALSTPKGRIYLSWSVESETLAVRWVEAGGPPIVAPPTRSGFGTMVLDYSISYELGGAAERRFAPGGLDVSLRLPLAGNVVSD